MKKEKGIDFEKVGLSSTWNKGIPAGVSWCFNTGIMGYCNEECPYYKSEGCEIEDE